MRILVIKPSSFGDIIHLFPALAMLRKKFPDGVLDFVVNPEFSSLLDFSPFPVRRRIIFERRKLASAGFFRELLALRRELRVEKYDAVIDFQGLFRSGFITFLSNGALKAGFSGARERSAEIFYDRKIKVSAVHAVERYGELVSELFDISEPLTQPDLPVNRRAAEELPELPEKYMVLLPGTRWESKRFPPEFFAGVCREISGKLPGIGFVAAGSAPERENAGKIGGNILNLAGKTTMPQLLELLRNAVAVIGNDSGPLHAAAALKRPVFGFYGPTDPVLTGPWGANCHFFYAGCECRGCLKRVCPDGSYRCWQLEAGKVAAEIVKQVEGEA